MTRLDNDVVLFSGGYNGAPKRVTRNGYSIIRGGRRYSVYFHAIFFMLRNRHNFDAVIDVQNGVPFWSPLFFRVPVFNLTHHIHREQWSSFFIAPIARFGWFIESKVAPFAYRKSRYITVSQSSRDELIDLGVTPERISIIYNGIDLPTGFSSNADLPRTAAPTLIAVGRLVPHKQVEFAIEALKRFEYSIPDLELHVLGDGYWLDQLHVCAKGFGVESRVHFHGFVDVERKNELLASSWAMAMPSLKEGWGLTIIEAGIHGTPTVAFSSAGGTKESVQDHVTGLLADNTEEFFESLFRILTDTDFRKKLGDNAKKHALSFNWEESGRALDRAIGDTAVGRPVERSVS